MEVERARKRSYAKEKKQQERREMNPVSDRQPIERGMRYANMRSAMAEEGVIRLLLQDDSLFPEQMPVLPEDFSSPALAHIYDEIWKRRGRGGVASLAAGSPDGDPAKAGIRRQRASGAGGLHTHHTGGIQQARRRSGSVGCCVQDV